jgi:drug/metabolite transporter superfamily protein YnfA
MRAAYDLSPAEIRAVHAFLASMYVEGTPETHMIPGYRGLTREQYWKSYQQWNKGGDAWDRLQAGGTYIIIALMWYHHVHKPGSEEWRPSIIIRALVAASVMEGTSHG